MIFVARAISAAILFFFLGKANIWLSAEANTVLAFGYRVFLLAAPLFMRFVGVWSTSLSFFIASLGVFCWTAHEPITGALLVALGLSCGGFLIKSQATETARGAASNKVALNMGSMASGALLGLPLLQSREVANTLGILALLCCAILGAIEPAQSWLRNRRLQGARPSLPRRYFFDGGLSAAMRWTWIGTAIGIKLFGVFSVLPQHLIATSGVLPPWFGAMILLNSALVILLQHLVMSRIREFSSSTVVWILAFGLVVLGAPGLFFADHWMGAAIWVCILSIIECCASRLDVDASADQALLPKEAAVGLGAALSVLCARNLPPHMGPPTLAALGLLALFAGAWMRRLVISAPKVT